MFNIGRAIRSLLFIPAPDMKNCHCDPQQQQKHRENCPKKKGGKNLN